MHRRHFLQALAAAGVTLPSLPGLGDQPAAPRPRHLLLIELQGGNDGLNTVVPTGDPLYRQLRPTLALRREAVLELDDGLGLHPALDPLMPLWARGQLAIVQGVGYPMPNRSHFRSIEIWETASAAEETRIEGWLAPLTAELRASGPDGVKALALAQDEGPLAGALSDAVVFENLDSFVREAQRLRLHEARVAGATPALTHLLDIKDAARTAAMSFAERLDEATHTTSSKGPALARRLQLVARLIQAGAGPQVFKVELGSFDTHAGQANKHRALLTQLADSLATFAESLDASGHWNDILVMTYSEFGRRVAENGNQGTDHGTAAPHFVLGGRVAGGLHGAQPDLSRLDKGDPEFTTDFRSMYATVARDWFGQSQRSAPFHEFASLPLIKNT